MHKSQIIPLVTAVLMTVFIAGCTTNVASVSELVSAVSSPIPLSIPKGWSPLELGDKGTHVQQWGLSDNGKAEYTQGAVTTFIFKGIVPRNAKFGDKYCQEHMQQLAVQLLKDGYAGLRVTDFDVNVAKQICTATYTVFTNQDTEQFHYHRMQIVGKDEQVVEVSVLDPRSEELAEGIIRSVD